jgi:hypothetical protein
MDRESFAAWVARADDEALRGEPAPDRTPTPA